MSSFDSDFDPSIEKILIESGDEYRGAKKSDEN